MPTLPSKKSLIKPRTTKLSNGIEKQSIDANTRVTAMSELYGKYFKAILIKNASMINYKHSETNEKKKVSAQK